MKPITTVQARTLKDIIGRELRQAHDKRVKSIAEATERDRDYKALLVKIAKKNKAIAEIKADIQALNAKFKGKEGVRFREGWEPPINVDLNFSSAVIDRVEEELTLMTMAEERTETPEQIMKRLVTKYVK